MSKQEIANSTEELAGLLCISIKDAWDFHTSDEIKEQFSFDEIEKCISGGTGTVA